MDTNLFPIWNGKKVTVEEYWKLRLEDVSKNPTQENLECLLYDLDMEIGDSRYEESED